MHNQQGYLYSTWNSDHCYVAACGWEEFGGGEVGFQVYVYRVLLFSNETIAILLISHTPTQNKKLKLTKKKTNSRITQNLTPEKKHILMLKTI